MTGKGGKWYVDSAVLFFLWLSKFQRLLGRGEWDEMYAMITPFLYIWFWSWAKSFSLFYFVDVEKTSWGDDWRTCLFSRSSKMIIMDTCLCERWVKSRSFFLHMLWLLCFLPFKVENVSIADEFPSYVLDPEIVVAYNVNVCPSLHTLFQFYCFIKWRYTKLLRFSILCFSHDAPVSHSGSSTLL